MKVEMQRGIAVELHIFRNYEARTSSSATLNGRPNLPGDILEVDGPRNPESEAARGWLQRLVRQFYRSILACQMIQEESNSDHYHQR